MSLMSEARLSQSLGQIMADSSAQKEPKEPNTRVGIITRNVPLWSLCRYTIITPKTLFSLFRPPYCVSASGSQARRATRTSFNLKKPRRLSQSEEWSSLHSVTC